jgi:hypothetical protein
MSVDKQWIDTIIYVAGSGIAATRLHIRREKALDETPFAMHHVAIVNGTQAIEVQWKVTTGTGTFYNRQLSIVKIG